MFNRYAVRRAYSREILEKTKMLPPNNSVRIESQVRISTPTMSNVIATIDAEPQFVSLADLESFLHSSNLTYALEEYLRNQRERVA